MDEGINSTSDNDKETSTNSEEEKDKNDEVKNNSRDERRNIEENVYENIQNPFFPVYEGEIGIRKIYVLKWLWIIIYNFD